eukprot:TRINITY_DN2775_c0_g1_i1.p1 TRINITY_DN2775_c0_g1~~TRINITY_DN2775_c0_g1_i1.p1  ORF type:complete len:781 (-),score=159.16 TRINITY_DN2775_c0_g1_i1:106-2448(-)
MVLLACRKPPMTAFTWAMLCSVVALAVGLSAASDDDFLSTCSSADGKRHKSSSVVNCANARRGAALLQRSGTQMFTGSVASASSSEGVAAFSSTAASGTQRVTSGGRARSLSKELLAHNALMHRSLTKLAITRAMSNGELDQLIEGFIDEQSGPGDQCTARLLEAKQQMNTLHSSLLDISLELNTTELNINRHSSQLSKIEQDIEQSEQVCRENTAKCEKQKREDIATYVKLKKEMKEMNQIANPRATIRKDELIKASSKSTIRTNETSSQTSTKRNTTMKVEKQIKRGTNTDSEMLLQIAAQAQSTHRSPGLDRARRVDAALNLIQDTKKMVESLNTCLAKQPSLLSVGLPTASLLQREQDHRPHEHMVQDMQGLLARLTQEEKQVVKADAGMGEGLENVSKDLPPGSSECLGWCSKASASWEEKCTWREKCGACAECLGCFGGSEVDITINGKSKAVKLRRPLAEGQMQSVQCEEVNPSTAGTLFLTCKGNGVLSINISSCVATMSPSEDALSETNCTALLANLQLTYVKAYVELSRLVSNYEEDANSTACMNGVEEECTIRRAPWEEKTEVLTKTISEEMLKLTSLRTRLITSTRAEVMLRKHVIELQESCADMDETMSSLDKVREAIRVMGLCPGLSRVTFAVPVWTGVWKKGAFDATKHTDEEIDAMMDLACSDGWDSDGPTPRAAEVSEIAQMTIEGLPMNNTAPVSVMGACPGCAGRPDTEGGTSHPSGHARRCWLPQTPFSVATLEDECGSHANKAVVCVIDRNLQDTNTTE